MKFRWSEIILLKNILSAKSFYQSAIDMKGWERQCPNMLQIWHQMPNRETRFIPMLQSSMCISQTIFYRTQSIVVDDLRPAPPSQTQWYWQIAHTYSGSFVILVVSLCRPHIVPSSAEGHQAGNWWEFCQICSFNLSVKQIWTTQKKLLCVDGAY